MNLSSLKKFFLLGLLVVGLGISGAFSCGGGSGDNLLFFPTIVVIDNVNQRVFVIESQDNRINLVDPALDEVVTDDEGDPILFDEDPILLPQFPQNASVADVGGGVSRMFVIGNNPGPNNQITVLDFDLVNGIRSAPFSPINVPGGGSDVLVGIVVDLARGRVFVSNSTTGMVHGFDINTGIEVPNSPVVVIGELTRMNVDPTTSLLAVGQVAGTLVSFIDLTDLTLPVVVLDVGVMIRDVAMSTNGSGSILFISASGINQSQAYRLDLADLTVSEMIFELNPPGPADPIPDPELLTGNLNLLTSGNLTDGRMASFYTQSSGDVLALDLTSDLLTLTPAIASIGAINAEGIAGLLNGSGQVSKVYFASPGVGALSVIDPLTNEFLDQIE